MATPDITLYHGAPSRSVRPYWLLRELNIPFEMVKKDFINDPSCLQGAYRNIHPLGGLPAITDGTDTVIESIAIMQYILEKYGNGRLQPAVGSKDRIKFLVFMQFSEATYGNSLVPYLYHTALLPEEKRNKAQAEQCLSNVTNHMKFMDSELASRDYIAGNEFTAADIALGMMLYLAVNIGNMINASNYPNLHKYYQRISERPAFQKAYNYE